MSWAASLPLKAVSAVSKIGTKTCLWGLVLAFTLPAASSAQPQTRPSPVEAEATIYRDANYSGPAVAIQAEERNLGLAWRVKSIRVPSGEWQLCSQPDYRGTCITVNRDRSSLGIFGIGLDVQSARYVGTVQGAAPGDGGESLRGMASQFYALPMLYGRTVDACRSGAATAACAAQAADAFCSRIGWRVSVHERMETRSGRVVLRDVLCSNADY